MTEISYSRGSVITDNQPQQCTAADFGQFCDALQAELNPGKGPAYVCGPVAGTRDKAHALPRRWLALDLDLATPEVLADLLMKLAGYSALAHTTASHTNTAPCVRVFVEMAAPADRASVIATSAWLRGQLGIEFDPATDRPEQPLYLAPAGATFWRFHGAPVVPRPGITVATVPVAIPVGPAHPLACRVAEADLEHIVTDLARAAPGQRNDLLARRAFKLGGYVAARRLDRAAVVQAVEPILATWADPEHDRATLDRQLTAGQREPLVLVVPDARMPVANAAPRSTGRIHNAGDLMGKRFKPVQWAIRDLVPEGVTILAGAPKSGKSFLVLQWAFAIATGCALWNDRPPEIQGRALYLALEDKHQRMQRRLQKLQMDRGLSLNVDLGRLDYAVEWDKAEEGVAAIREYLTKNPDCRLVAVDTMSTFRNTDPGRKSAYAHDYEVGAMFKPLCREFNVAIILVSHTRKQAADDPMDTVSGTQGLTGSVDNILTLQKPKRAMGDDYSVLHVDGRDIENPVELALTRNAQTGFWACLGHADEVSRTNESQAVLKVLATIGMGSPREIHAAMGGEVKLPTLTRRLARMAQRGEIYRSRHGQYLLNADTDDLPAPPPIVPPPGAV